MSYDHESLHLLNQWKAGDQDAAEEIFSRYMNRLIGLAKSRLSEKMKSRVDPEDIVQSAYRSFFRHAQDDRYELRRSGDLWRLLAAITINKTMGQVEFHTAAKRSIDQEGELTAESVSHLVAHIAVSREPSVEEAVALTDEIEVLLAMLQPNERSILELRLQGKSSEQIAEELQCSPRTVRRTVERVKKSLSDRLTE